MQLDRLKEPVQGLASPACEGAGDPVGGAVGTLTDYPESYKLGGIGQDFSEHRSDLVQVLKACNRGWLTDPARVQALIEWAGWLSGHPEVSDRTRVRAILAISKLGERLFDLILEAAHAG